MLVPGEKEAEIPRSRGTVAEGSGAEERPESAGHSKDGERGWGGRSWLASTRASDGLGPGRAGKGALRVLGQPARRGRGASRAPERPKHSGAVRVPGRPEVQSRSPNPPGRADNAAPRSAPQHSAASSEREPRRTNARDPSAAHTRLAPPSGASHWLPDTAPSTYWTAENAAHLPGFDWSKCETMPAHLFQRFQLVIGFNICPFAPPSLEIPSCDWLKTALVTPRFQP